MRLQATIVKALIPAMIKVTKNKCMGCKIEATRTDFSYGEVWHDVCKLQNGWDKLLIVYPDALYELCREEIKCSCCEDCSLGTCICEYLEKIYDRISMGEPLMHKMYTIVQSQSFPH